MSPQSFREWESATSAWRRSPSGNGRPNSSIKRREEPPESVIATIAHRFRVTFFNSESIVNEPVPPPMVTTRSDTRSDICCRIASLPLRSDQLPSWQPWAGIIDPCSVKAGGTYRWDSSTPAIAISLSGAGQREQRDALAYDQRS